MVIIFQQREWKLLQLKHNQVLKKIMMFLHTIFRSKLFKYGQCFRRFNLWSFLNSSILMWAIPRRVLFYSRFTKFLIELFGNGYCSSIYYRSWVWDSCRWNKLNIVAEENTGWISYRTDWKHQSVRGQWSNNNYMSQSCVSWKN